jgi:hypothetical protein
MGSLQAFIECLRYGVRSAITLLVGAWTGRRDSDGASAGALPTLSMSGSKPCARPVAPVPDHPVARTFAAPFGVG